MTDKTLKLSAIGRAMLTLAATHEDRLVPPPKLPVAAARQVVRSLINNSLLEEVSAGIDDPGLVWRTGDDGVPMVLRATGAGINAVFEGASISAQRAPDDWCDRIEPTSSALIALVEQVEKDKQAHQQPPDDDVTIETFAQDVVRFLNDLRCEKPAQVLEREEPAHIVRDGFDAAIPAGVVAEHVMTWRDEQELTRSTASGDSAKAAGLARRRIRLRQAAEAVVAAWEKTDSDTRCLTAC